MKYSALLFALLVLAWPATLFSQVQDPVRDQIPERMSYLDNGTIRIGVNLSIGGAITYLAESDKQINMINSHDWGRQIQMSFYSGPQPFVPEGATVSEAWKGLGWNPIQSGDCYSFPSEILEHRNDGQSIYVRCIPKIWPLRNVPGECEFECWIRLEENRAHIKSRMVNLREDTTQYVSGGQELPAIYTNGPWYKLVTYMGDNPFEGEELSVLVDKGDGKGWPWRTWYTPEYWAALVDKNDHGLGIYEPGIGCYSGGFAGRDEEHGTGKGSGGPKDFATGYMTPRERDILDHNIDYSYEYTLIVGSLDEIRGYVYAQEQPSRLPLWEFKADRQHWHYRNTGDAGWPIEGCLEVNLGSEDARMIGPQVIWKAEVAPKLYLKAAFETKAKEIGLLIYPFDEADRTDWDQWGDQTRPGREGGIEIKVPIQGDGKVRTLEIDLSKEELYRGPMTQIQIQLPAVTGKARIYSMGFRNPYLWTFDCGYEGWKDYCVDLGHAYPNENGGLVLKKLDSGRMLSQTGLAMEASKHDHLLLGIKVKNPPAGKMKGKLINYSAGNATFDFTWNAAEPILHVDLGKFKSWKGVVDDLSLILSGVAPDAEVFVDWIAFSDEEDYRPLSGDQQTRCHPASPRLSDPESVVFCNRATMTANFSGGVGNARVNLWNEAGDTLQRAATFSKEEGMYFSFYDLETSTDYYWQMEVSNSKGRAKTAVQYFRTEDSRAEDMPMRYWMTPSPFKLLQNINDHLFESEEWIEAAMLADVYKIHGAILSSQWQFQRLNVPKLVYICNKYRMRIAWENIIAGSRDGHSYAGEILDMIDYIASCGGKLDFFTWDGMMFRCFMNFRTPEEGLEEVAEAVRIVKEKYPDFEIIPLPNLPNWTFKDIPFNAGDFASQCGVSSWDYLCDIFLKKLEEKGLKTNFIMVDHPFNYYHRNSREESARRISSIKSYCEEHGMEMILIINSSGYRSLTKEQVDEKFKEDCLQYLKDLKEDGITPDYIDVESWYPYPQYLVPETKKNSFTNVVRDVGRAFKGDR